MMCTMVVGTVLVVSVTPVSNEKKAAGDEGDIDDGVNPINHLGMVYSTHMGILGMV